jgi:hypothetical protein
MIKYFVLATMEQRKINCFDEIKKKQDLQEFFIKMNNFNNIFHTI